MIDVGFTELLLISLVGLLVLGPDSLPDAMRTFFRWYLQLSKKFQQVRTDLGEQFRNAEITQSFEQDKEKLIALDEELRSTHLDLLESFGSKESAKKS
jgi:sec-independent protein translocase protein TatB